MRSVLQHFVCTLFVTFFAQNLFALSREWVAIDLPGVDQAWKNADVTVTYVDHLDPETFPLSKADVEHALRGIYLVRKASMEKLGFKNIVFSFYETELRNNRSQLYIAGHYLQPDGVGIHFLEVHIAEPGRFSHISLLRPLNRTKQRLDRSELLPFINETNPHKRTPASDELSALNECLDCYQCDDERKTFTANFRALNEVAVKASVASKSPDCQKETFLYNPETTSMLDTLGIGYKGSNPLIHGSRAAISCLYGGAKGAFGSVKDLVMLIPKFLSFSAKQLKAAGNAISNFEAPDVSFQKIWKNISPQKIKDSVGNAVQVSSDTLVSTFKMTTASLYKHYEKGGISGTLAAVSRAAYDSSPHKIVGNWLAEVTQSIAETMAKEWTGLTCLDPSVIAEAVCGVISYVGVDIITGKVVVSALSKSAKFAEAMTAVRNKLEKAPITGEWLTKHLKPADPSQCAEPQNESWMVDADAKLQGQHLLVTVSKGLVLAKGIHPKTGKLECFQVIGKQGDQIRNRVSSTADRTKTAPAVGSTDFFSPQNSKIARTEENYVRDINGRVGVSISNRHAKDIGAALKKQPELAEKYGALHRRLDESKEKLKRLASGTPEHGALSSNIRLQEETISHVNDILRVQRGDSTINLTNINTILEKSQLVESQIDVKLLNRLLYEIKGEIKNGDIDKAVTVWTEKSLKKSPSLQKSDFDNAMGCLTKVAK